jgi:hypothetical protein
MVNADNGEVHLIRWPAQAELRNPYMATGVPRLLVVSSSRMARRLLCAIAKISSAIDTSIPASAPIVVVRGEQLTAELFA